MVGNALGARGIKPVLAHYGAQCVGHVRGPCAGAVCAWAVCGRDWFQQFCYEFKTHNRTRNREVAIRDCRS